MFKSDPSLRYWMQWRLYYHIIYLTNKHCIENVGCVLQVQSCKIICSIESVDTDWGWFYFGCVAHNKRATKIRNNQIGNLTQNDKPLWRCEKCHSHAEKIEPK